MTNTVDASDQVEQRAQHRGHHDNADPSNCCSHILFIHCSVYCGGTAYPEAQGKCQMGPVFVKKVTKCSQVECHIRCAGDVLAKYSASRRWVQLDPPASARGRELARHHLRYWVWVVRHTKTSVRLHLAPANASLLVR